MWGCTLVGVQVRGTELEKQMNRVQIRGKPPRQYCANRNRPDVEAVMTERTLTAHTCAEVHACRATVECAVEQRRRRTTVEGKYFVSKAHVQNITEKEFRMGAFQHHGEHT